MTDMEPIRHRDDIDVDVVILPMSGIRAGKLVSDLLLKDGKAENPMIYYTPTRYDYISSIRPILDHWEGVKVVYVVMDSLKPDEDITIIEDIILCPYKNAVRYVVFKPGFDYIFGDDEDSIEHYLEDRQVPTGNVRKAKILFRYGNNEDIK